MRRSILIALGGLLVLGVLGLLLLDALLTGVLIGSRGESTTARTTEETTTESAVVSEEGEEGVTPATPAAATPAADTPARTPPAPTPPTPTPPAPTPPPVPVVQEVTCGIGAFNVLNCTSAVGEQFSCSGDSSEVGGSYSCTDSTGNPFGCEVVASQMGGFTLSCTRLLQ